MPTNPSEPRPQSPPSNATATSDRCPAFVETLEYRRFTEFCDACRRYRYIGLCFGAPGIGKTLSAARYSRAESVDSCDKRTEEWKEAATFDTVLYTPSIVNTPSGVAGGIRRACERLEVIAKRPIREEARKVLDALRAQDDAARTGYFDRPSSQWKYPLRPSPTFLDTLTLYNERERAITDPTTLILIDEADRLRMNSLEQVRDRFDVGGVGLILIGMPGIEKRLARYPQLYSRIGFVHEFRVLSAANVHDLLETRWAPDGVTLPEAGLSAEAIAAVIRVTGGNFRLLNRLLTQIERILEVNHLEEITVAVVQAARESLVIGQA